MSKEVRVKITSSGSSSTKTNVLVLGEREREILLKEKEYLNDTLVDYLCSASLPFEHTADLEFTIFPSAWSYRIRDRSLTPLEVTNWAVGFAPFLKKRWILPYNHGSFKHWSLAVVEFTPSNGITPETLGQQAFEMMAGLRKERYDPPWASVYLIDSLAASSTHSPVLFKHVLRLLNLMWMGCRDDPHAKVMRVSQPSSLRQSSLLFQEVDDDDEWNVLQAPPHPLPPPPPTAQPKSEKVYTKDNVRIQMVDGPKQKDGWSCGIYTGCAASAIALASSKSANWLEHLKPVDVVGVKKMLLERMNA
jgi:hypothetical protein